MQIILKSGLMLRHGQRTLEIIRELNDEDYSIEDVITKRHFVINRHTILKRIWDKTYFVILPEGASFTKGEYDTNNKSPTEIDLSSLTDKEKNEIERKLRYIKALEKAHISKGQRDRIQKIIPKVSKQINDKNPPSASTLMTWVRTYQKSMHSPLSLLSGNRHRRRSRRIEEPLDKVIHETIKSTYLTRSRYSLSHTLNVINKKARDLATKGEINPEKCAVSMSTLSRRVNDIDLYHRIAARDGIERARYVTRTAMNIEQPLYPLARVEVDHTQLNWVVICDRTGLPLGRPLLTVAIDAFSGYLLGFYLSFYGPGVTSVSGVLRNAVMPKTDFTKGVKLINPWIAAGIPDLLVLDNGLEFHAQSFKMISWNLGMSLMHCRVRTPWLKPHVERFFATLNYLTLTKGRVYRKLPNILNIDPKKDAAISFSNLVKGLIMFCADAHPLQINNRKLARPIDLMREGIESRPPVAFPGDIESLRLASALSKELTCTPGGIELLGIPYGSSELLPMRKAYGNRFNTTIKWDPDDINSIWIQDPKTKSWVQSPSRWPHYTSGLSWNQHKLIRNFARSELKRKGAYEDLAEAQLRLHDFWMDATSKRSTADMRLASRFSGATSAQVMSSEENPHTKKIVIPVADTEAPTIDHNIPAFDSFFMK